MWGQVSHLAGGKQIPGKQRIRCPVSGEQLSLILPPPLLLSLSYMVTKESCKTLNTVLQLLPLQQVVSYYCGLQVTATP